MKAMTLSGMQGSGKVRIPGLNMQVNAWQINQAFEALARQGIAVRHPDRLTVAEKAQIWQALAETFQGMKEVA